MAGVLEFLIGLSFAFVLRLFMRFRLPSLEKHEGNSEAKWLSLTFLFLWASYAVAMLASMNGNDSLLAGTSGSTPFGIAPGAFALGCFVMASLLMSVHLGSFRKGFFLFAIPVVMLFMLTIAVFDTHELTLYVIYGLKDYTIMGIPPLANFSVIGFCLCSEGLEYAR